MNTRTLAIVSTAVIGTPLLAAAVLAVCSPTVAVIVCLAVAGAGVVGTAVGVRQISAALPRKAEGGPLKAEVDCSLDSETREALLRLGDKINGKNTP